MPFTRAGGHRLEYLRIEGAQPAIVMLHEGLGSVSMWKQFPVDVARATGSEIIVYSRYGHGESEPLTAARDVRYMHREALEVLPELLESLAVERPVLLGHSDGASIALIYAGAFPAALHSVIALAPHVFVEDISVTSIAATGRAFTTTDLRARLARYHADVDGVFRGWNDIWLAPAFRDWSIENDLLRISVPVLAVQGLDDEYGTLEQIRRIERAVPQTRTVELAHCGHSPHRDQPAALLDAIRSF